MAPDSSVQSSTSLKNLGSKVVKGLGQLCPTKAGPSSSAETAVSGGGGGGGGMAGGLGFGGSMLGEVLVSYSTSSLPPGKRHSIAATSAHLEELAAEAGIDMDADEINIEDLRMYRVEDDSGYKIGGGGDGDGDGDGDDGNDDDENSHDDDAHTSANQKLAHKERSILQMVDVLSDRLTSLNAVVINRYNGCKSDLDEATDFRSSRTKKMAIIAEEDWSCNTPRKGPDKAKRQTIFNQGGGGEGEGGDIVGPPRMTFRNAPQTDAGRKLAHQFEQEYGLKQVRLALLLGAHPLSWRVDRFPVRFLKKNWCSRSTESGGLLFQERDTRGSLHVSTRNYTSSTSTVKPSKYLCSWYEERGMQYYAFKRCLQPMDRVCRCWFDLLCRLSVPQYFSFVSSGLTLISRNVRCARTYLAHTITTDLSGTYDCRHQAPRQSLIRRHRES